MIRDPEVDAVYVATPVRLHVEHAVAAAEAGKHVLCEKPMALDVAECERMRAAARAHGVRLGVAYYRHHYPIVGRLRALVASGEIGAPVIANVQAFEHFDPGPDHPRAWLLRRSESGGGPMMDFGCHRIEVLLDVLGPVAEVDGFPANAHLPGPRSRGHVCRPPGLPQRRAGRACGQPRHARVARHASRSSAAPAPPTSPSSTRAGSGS